MTEDAKPRRGPGFWLIRLPLIGIIVLVVGWVILRVTWDWRPIDYHERFNVDGAVMTPLVIEGVTFGEGEYTLSLDMARRGDPFFGKFIVVTDPDGISAEVVNREIPSDSDESADKALVVFTIRLSPPPESGQVLEMELQSLYYSDAFTVRAP